MTSTITATTSSTRSSFASAGFQPHLIPIPPSTNDSMLNDLEIYALQFQSKNSNKKEPILFIHGHPQNLSIWHRVAPALVKEEGFDRDLILVDLRGYGHSGVPRVRNFVKLGHENPQTKQDDQDRIPEERVLRARYSKREMARDLVMVMKHFGYEKFAVVGHDRGGRVAHRMAVDNPDIVTRVMTLDIVPTYDLYTKAEAKFAIAYWHWFFLIQEYPMPEEMIVHAPKAYLNKLVTRFNVKKGENKKETEEEEDKVFPPDILQTYLAMLSSPPRVHAMCEDYRCSAPGGTDFEQDEKDRKEGKKISQPFRALWGKMGVNQALFGDQGPIELWQNVCQTKVTGKSIECGHYMPEEAPKEIVQEILTFFG